MSQDQDPIDATRRFEPVDPYNIAPHDAASAPGYGGDEGYQAGYGEPPHDGPPPSPQGFKRRLTRLGPLKLALLGTAGVIVLGGAAWGTTAALSSGSSSTTAAAAPATEQSPGQSPGDGATTGGTGKHAKAPKAARIKITQLGNGSFTGTVGKGGKTVTVDYGAGTRFGTKARPLSSDGLQVGMTVAVVGALQGDTIAASDIVLAPKQAKAPAPPGGGANPTDPASPVGGNA